MDGRIKYDPGEHIEKKSSMKASSPSSKELSEEHDENVAIARALDLVEETSSNSSSSVDLSRSGDKVDHSFVGGIVDSNFEDVADLAAEDFVETRDLMGLQRAMANSEYLKKHSSELNKAQKKANTLEVDLKKAKETLAAVERAHDANDFDIGQKTNNALQDLAKLQKVAIGLVYQQVFDCGFNQTRDYYLRQAVVSCEAVFLDPLKPYSPMILPNQPVEEGVKSENEVKDLGAANKLGAKARARGARTGGQDNPSKCKVLYCIQGGWSFLEVDLRARCSYILPMPKEYLFSALPCIYRKVLSSTTSWLRAEIKSIAMVCPMSPSKIDAKPANAAACEFKSLSICSIWVALNSESRVFAIAKYLAIFAPRASNFLVTWLTTRFE
ncbi:hypothetical protein Acr_10g0007080 [Actinidia rufa]|uniref:Uncharacterized protein n=1 Tax=Actinidia rufa TaxID=165716 RepID=A0A7J0F9P1_9ERIC|nr:hypothetical protein Acr_10g0007080 [Actinidia rufa]